MGDPRTVRIGPNDREFSTRGILMNCVPAVHWVAGPNARWTEAEWSVHLRVFKEGNEVKWTENVQQTSRRIRLCPPVGGSPGPDRCTAAHKPVCVTSGLRDHTVGPPPAREVERGRCAKRGPGGAERAGTRARAKSGDGPVQIARMFKLAKDSAVKARTQAINQLKAVLVTADRSCGKNWPG
ncbi:hypothetical protein ACWIGX_19390 [Streptomyces nigrescens]